MSSFFAKVPPAWAGEHRSAFWLEQLMRCPSVGGSSGESQFAAELQAKMAQLPFFVAHPEHLWLQATGHNDSDNLFAFVPGNGKKTVLLTGHFDTVSTANFGPLEPLAHSPAELQEAILAELAATKARHGAEFADVHPGLQLAERDLSGGEFWAGRGMLDMKSGLAAGLSVLEAFAQLPENEREGNLLLVFSPDEEDSSRGARASRAEIARLVRERGLEVVGGINLDATSDQGDGSEGRAIHLGSVGKMLGMVMWIGRDTHAGFPTEGISAHSLAAELLGELELNPKHADAGEGEQAPAIVALSSRDFREQYDVTTPRRVLSAYNILLHGRSAKATLDLLKTEAEAAMQRVLSRHREHAKGAGKELSARSGEVFLLSEVAERVLANPVHAAEYERLIASLAHDNNPIEVSTRVMHWLLDRAEFVAPAAIIACGSLVYPTAHVRQHGEAGERLAKISAEIAAERGLKVRQFFAGISDMSFIGLHADEENAEFIRANHSAPTPQFLDAPPAETVAFPVVNVGPWGRDYHQRLERVHAHFAIVELPAVVGELAARLLRG